MLNRYSARTLVAAHRCLRLVLITEHTRDDSGVATKVVPLSLTNKVCLKSRISSSSLYRPIRNSTEARMMSKFEFWNVLVPFHE